MNISIEKKILKWSIDHPMLIALTDADLCKQLNEKLSHQQDNICPYCGQLICPHWTGLGWMKPEDEGE